LITEVLGARGELSAEDSKRMGEIAKLFGLDVGTARGHLREVPKKPQAKAS
jgi:predicted transcriptional regulator